MANAFTIPENLILDIGNYSNDGTGDDLRTAFQKIAATFNLINSELGLLDAANITGAGEGLYSSKVNNILQFKRITGSSGVTVTSTDTTVNIAALANVEGDTSPALGGNLSLNGYNVYGASSPGGFGDVKSTVWGLDIREVNDRLNTVFNSSNFTNLDLGTFNNPLTDAYDLGTF
jgi:hypothetical protein